MKDEGLESYVEAIEGHLRARRGVDHVLNPRDFALAKGWHAAGVPLATVLVGMDRAFDQGTSVTSLAYCRRRIEDLAAAATGPRNRPSPPAESVPAQEVVSLLNGLLAQLELIRAPAGAPFRPPTTRIREMRDLLEVASRPNWAYVRAQLQDIDDEVSACVLQAFSAEQIEDFRKEAEEATARHRGRVDDDALADAVRRFTLQRAREKLGLVRVGLL